MLSDISKKQKVDGQQLTVDGQEKSAGFGGTGRVIGFTLGIFIISQVIAGLITMMLLRATGRSLSLDNSNAAQFIYVLLAEGMAAWLVFVIIKKRGLGLKSIGLGRKPQWRDIKRAALGFVMFYALVIIATIIVNFLFPSVANEQQDVGFNTLNTLSDSFLAFAALVILPPLGEEVLARGYLFSGLRRGMKFWPALIITSLLFGAAHLGGADKGLLWSGALDTFLLSGVLVYLRENTGALYAGMLVHMLNNIIAFGVHFH